MPKVNPGTGKAFYFLDSATSKLAAKRLEAKYPGSFIQEKDGRYYILKPKKIRSVNPRQPRIEVGNIVRLKGENVTRGYVQRVNRKNGQAWVRWEDGEYTVEWMYQLVRSHEPRSAKRLPNNSPVQIYGRVLRIEAVKTSPHTYGGKPSKADQHYFHDFTTKNAVLYGLPDGSLLIKSKR